jgi:hypothetical protein
LDHDARTDRGAERMGVVNSRGRNHRPQSRQKHAAGDALIRM